MNKTKASANIGLIIGAVVVVAAGVGYFAFLRPTQIEPPAVLPPSPVVPPPAVTPPVAPPPAGKLPPPSAALNQSGIKTYNAKAIVKDQNNSFLTFYYELWYPEKDFSISSNDSEITLRESNGNVHKIMFLNPRNFAGSVSNYWKTQRNLFCSDCDNITEINGYRLFNSSSIFANNKEEWVIVDEPAIFANLKKPADKAKQVLASLQTYPSPRTMKIKLSLLKEQEGVYHETRKGCDEIVYVERSIEETQRVLDAAIRELFYLRNSPQIMVGGLVNSLTRFDYASSHASIDFDRAIIENGIAKIYLQYLVFENDPYNYNKIFDVIDGGGPQCRSQLQAQIEGTAYQFPTVKSVEVYINNKKVEPRFNQLRG